MTFLVLPPRRPACLNERGFALGPKSGNTGLVLTSRNAIITGNFDTYIQLMSDLSCHACPLPRYPYIPIPLPLHAATSPVSLGPVRSSGRNGGAACSRQS